jgi:hypothetical protein
MSKWIINEDQLNTDRTVFEKIADDFGKEIDIKSLCFISKKHRRVTVRLSTDERVDGLIELIQKNNGCGIKRDSQIRTAIFNLGSRILYHMTCSKDHYAKEFYDNIEAMDRFNKKIVLLEFKIEAYNYLTEAFNKGIIAKPEYDSALEKIVDIKDPGVKKAFMEHVDKAKASQDKKIQYLSEFRTHGGRRGLS